MRKHLRKAARKDAKRATAAGGAGRAARSGRSGPAPGGAPEPLRRAVEALARLSEAFERRRRQLARELGLTDAQLRVLEEIARDDFMPSLFARQRACTPAAVSRVLRQLQDAGWVRAGIGARDARQRDYRLTASGRRLVERLRARRREALDAVWGDMPAADLARFGAFSEALAERLHAYADRSAGGD